MLFQQILNGLSIGSIYALMAVGYSLVYSILNFTNFAHGFIVTLGSYLGFYALTLISPKLSVAILLAIMGGGLVSVTYELLTYHPLIKKGTKRLYLIIAGLGISIVGENLIIVTIGGRFRAYPKGLSLQTVNIMGANIGLIDLQILILSVIALLVVELLISHTKTGLAVRAAAFSLDATSLMGVDVYRLVNVVFMMAGSLAGLAGVFLGIKYTAYPTMGWITNKAFIAAVIGGLGSLPGAGLGAIFLGLCETLVSAYLSSSLRDVITFVLFILVLLFRPTGFMGKETEEKA